VSRNGGIDGVRIAVAMVAALASLAPSEARKEQGNVEMPAGEAGAVRASLLSEARLTIFKRSRALVVSSEGMPLKTYGIELGRDAEQPKRRVGDGRTPEGQYFICERRLTTRYHRALLLSYPNAADAARGLREGLISAEEAAEIRHAIAEGRCPPQNTPLGGMILIHGQHPEETVFWENLRRASGRHGPCGSEPGDRSPDATFVRIDWTQGCIALRNQDIRELFELLPVGTPVTIAPGAIPPVEE
jgi:murein L,D-transpeptidase YafK